VLNYRPFYIMGQVNSPGSYSYVNGITVLEAVVIAGGFTKRAKESRMTIIRGTDRTREKQDATPQTVVLPGDVIEVPQRYF
jgi:polysaccharide export outer membrane protein